MIIRLLFSKRLLFLALLLFACSTVIFGQENGSFETHFKNSIELNKLSQFSESIKELEIAIKIASDNNFDKEYIEASIFMGEMMRRTADHKKGLEILEALKNSETYLNLHVRKLGRIAALYAEGGENLAKSPKDSLQKYLKIALKIAIDNKFELEEAGLSNEYGYYKLHNESKEAAKPYLVRSASIFKKLNDENNYVVVMCHVLYITVLENKLNESDNIIKELLNLVANKKWFGTEQTLYRNISQRYLTVNDSINYYKWKLKEEKAATNLLTRRNSDEMSFYRVKYETEKFKNQAIKLDLNAKAQKKKTTILWFFIIIFSVLMFIVIVLFIKKRRLANGLKISNEKFQMLMVESNHRIKNNLQMILSMVDYSNDDSNTSKTKTLNKISGKIQTVSVLHKHLYADVHNEFIGIDIYFDEIIRLYSQMNPDSLVIIKNIQPIQIKSERIVYFGLILNELFANTLEHCLAEIRKVNLSVYAFSDFYIFEYKDESPHAESSQDSGKGSILLNQLIKRVNGTNYTLDKKSGTHKFEFKNVN